MQTTKRLVAFGLAALVVAGCSNNEASAPSTTPESATTSVADTTAATSSSLPSTTSSTTIAATTLPAITTTVATEDAIKAAVQEYFAAYHQCGAVPSACIPENFTAVEGRSRSTITELATGMTQQGLYFLSDTRGSYVVAESVSFLSSSNASAVYCVFDAVTVVGPNGPDGAPTVLNDQMLSLKNEYRLFLEDGTWKVGEQLKLLDLGIGSLCPPSG